MFCPKCGVENASESVKYCSKCGMNLTVSRASLDGRAEKAITLLSGRGSIFSLSYCVALTGFLTFLGTVYLGKVAWFVCPFLCLAILFFPILEVYENWKFLKQARELLPLDEAKAVASDRDARLKEKSQAQLPAPKTQAINRLPLSVTEGTTESLESIDNYECMLPVYRDTKESLS